MKLQGLGRFAYVPILVVLFLANCPSALSGVTPVETPAETVFIEVAVLSDEPAAPLEVDFQAIGSPSRWRASATMETRSSGFFAGVIEEFEVEAMRKIGGATRISLRQLFKGKAKEGFRAGIAKYEANFELNILRDLVRSIHKNLQKFDRKLQKGADKGAALALMNAELSLASLRNLQPGVEQKFAELKSLYKSKRYESKLKELGAIRVFMEQDHEISDRRAQFFNDEDYSQELRDQKLRVNSFKTAGRVTAIMTTAVIGLGITAAIPPAFGVALPVAAIAAMGVEGARGVCESGTVLRTHFLLADQVRGVSTLTRAEIERSERHIRKAVQIGLGVAIMATAGVGTAIEAVKGAVGYSVFLGVIVGADLCYVVPATIGLVKDLESVPQLD